MLWASALENGVVIVRSTIAKVVKYVRKSRVML